MTDEGCAFVSSRHPRETALGAGDSRILPPEPWRQVSAAARLADNEQGLVRLQGLRLHAPVVELEMTPGPFFWL